ncbi:MAG: tetratricopeptide repeat protein [Desulfuromonadales bacterium]
MSGNISGFSSRTPILLLWALLLSGGCAHETPKPTEEIIKPPEKPVINSQELEKSEQYEQKGDLTAAVERLKIALTIDPGNIRAQEEMKRLIVKRNSEAEKRYQAGLARKKTDPDGARKEFLAALRIRSDYTEAVRALKDLQLESSEFSIQTRARKEAASRIQVKHQESVEDILEEAYIDNAIAFYDAGNYAAAIQELQQAKIRSPNDPEINKYLNLSWYNSGIAWFKMKEYKKALDAFSKVKKKFENSDDYIRKSRLALTHDEEELYKMGLKFFREQKLQEAITKWNAVLAINPGHSKAKEYIEKTKKLLNALKEHR